MGKRKTTIRRPTKPRSVTSSQSGDPWGCMAGTVTIVPGTDLTAPSEDKWNAEENRTFNQRDGDDAR
jgi:hypothetical protein